MRLYDILKAAKLGAASDVFTTLRGQQAPFAKSSGTGVKELQDDPPLSFTGNGEPLIDWNIYGVSGGVGNKTANLCTGEFIQGGINNQGYEVSSTTRVRIYCAVSENTTYTFKSNQSIRCIYAYNNNSRVNLILDNSTNPNLKQYSFATAETVNKIGFALMKSDNTDLVPTDVENAMLNEGSTAADYEPYGYKISVTCGGETKTIYLDEPLGASDSISMTDTGISIPTVDGSNTLTVGTTVQPSKVYIKYKE